MFAGFLGAGTLDDNKERTGACLGGVVSTLGTALNFTS